jgi:hypothetical protein
MKKQACRFSAVFLAAISLGFFSYGGDSESIRVRVSPFRVSDGDTVTIRIEQLRDSAEALQAVLVKPLRGTSPLSLSPVAGSPGVFQTVVKIGNDSPQGMYAVHAWTGNSRMPAAVGKGTFLHGKIFADFFIAGVVDSKQPQRDILEYMDEFQKIGGNFLIAHALINDRKAFYPSKICKTDVAPGSPQDLVETVFANADRMGFPVMLSISWDTTRDSDSREYPGQIRAIASELYGLYRHHPSLVGMYSYQEGSGTYLVPYLRDFCDHVKTLNRGLLTGCAPYVDDPLLSGYMGTVESLDMIVFQGMTMASYRPDNRQCYPLRRVRDFCSQSVGAARFQDKIAVTHVELFGYLENRLAPDNATTRYENIYPQILSAATVAAADGISFFTYHPNIYAGRRKFPSVERSRRAVADGIRAFDLIGNRVSRGLNRVAIYFPYSDWVIERWHNDYLPALDGFRVLGIPADFLPYTPPARESTLPFYPFHKNDEALDKLLRERTILVLPNVSGFQKTDSDFIRAFVERGGVIIAFGPQIPMGNSYKRDELFGAAETGTKEQIEIEVRSASGKRVAAGTRFTLPPGSRPCYQPGSARVVATFADGSPAVFANRSGQGLAVAFVTDLATASRSFPDLVRDVIDEALGTVGRSRLVDILGTDENFDMAVSATPGGFRAAVVNHHPQAREIILRPLDIPAGARAEWYQLASGAPIPMGSDAGGLKMTVDGLSYAAVEFKIKK